MRALLCYIMPIMLLTSCAHSDDLEPNFHVLNHEYDLVTMRGHDLAMQRDKDVLGPASLKQTSLIVSNHWNGDIDWIELNIGDCVRYTNTTDGLSEVLHRCTELIEVDGVEKEYVPYTSASKNFVESVAPKIASMRKLPSSDEVVWNDINGEELAKFRFKKNVDLK